MKPNPSCFLLALWLLGACAPPGPSTGVAAALIPPMSKCDTAHDQPLHMARGENADAVQIMRAAYEGARVCRQAAAEIAQLSLPVSVHEACDDLAGLKAESLELMPLLQGETAAAAKPAIKEKLKVVKATMRTCMRAVQAADPGAAAWVREAKARGEIPA